MVFFEEVQTVIQRYEPSAERFFFTSSVLSDIRSFSMERRAKAVALMGWALPILRMSEGQIAPTRSRHRCRASVDLRTEGRNLGRRRPTKGQRD